MNKLGIFSACKLLWNIANKKEKAIFITLLFACVLRVSSDLLIPLVTACVVAKLSGNDASILFIKFPSSMSNISVILIAFGLLFSCAMLGSCVRALIRLFGTRMMNKTSEEALKYVLEYRKNFNLNMTNGEASYIIKNASENVTHLIQTLLVNCLVPIISSIIAIVYIANINIYAFIIIIATMIFISLSIWFRIHFDKKVYKRFEQINGKISNHALNNIENLPFISFFKTKATELEILHDLNKEYYKYEKKKSYTYLIYWLMTFIIEFSCTISIVVFISSNNVSDIASTLIVIIPYMMQIFNSVENLAFIFGNCQQYSIKISRLLLLKANPENLIILKNENSETAYKLPQDNAIEKITISNMQVEVGDFSKTFEHVTFSKGQINCLAGGSGSGKTTLLNCMLGLKEYKSGEILINDQYKLNSLFFENERISLSFQGENFFDRTLTENVDYPQKTLSPESQELIKYFELEEVFKRENEGNENIKETLSGGEKKRINFIRCASKKAEVYIFDEPTNELDERNVKKILEKLKTLKENALVIVVSHDKRLLAISENIIYL